MTPARLAALAGAALLAVTTQAADPARALERYRAASSMVEPGAASERDALLREVVELDPRGVLADDALVELARMQGVPEWPERVGAIEASGLQQALPLLDRVLTELPDADRASEARYLRGLLALEPLAASTSSDFARTQLAAVVREGDARWRDRARYALGWLEERAGHGDRARAVLERLVIESPEGEIATRARVVLARRHLVDGAPGTAARLAQEAIDASASPETHAEPTRELAVRGLLAEIGATPATTRATAVSKTRLPANGAGGIVALPDGGLVLGDRRLDRVVALDAEGGIRSVWQLEDLEIVAGDLAGGVWAVAGGHVYRLLAHEQAQRVAATGEWTPVADLAADTSGAVWLLDRRGRIGWIAPGTTAPVALWASETGRVRSIAWDGRRLLAGDDRQGLAVAIELDGTARPLTEQGFARPEDIAADGAGRFAVLDARAGYIYLHRRDGTVIDIYPFANDGIERPVALSFEIDGTLHVYDEAGPSWTRRP